MDLLNATHQTNKTTFKTVSIDGLNIFYRESGSSTSPTILLFHGFPSSSHMYRDLITDLSAKYHLIAPDYPGFGYSSCPSPETFDYTFDQLATIMEHFIDTLGLKHFSLYMQDYGGPIGFRIAARRPELIQSLIIQNANIYNDGLGPDVQKIGALEKAGDIAGLKNAIDYLLSFDGIKEQYIYGAGNNNLVNPDAYWNDHFFMERKGNKEIQSVLFQNYPANFPKYGEWQNYLRSYQPPALIVWGKNDKIFTAPGAQAYKKDLKHAEIHLLDGGHFALEEYHAEIALLMDIFLYKNLILQPKQPHQ